MCTSQRVVDVILKAFGACAASQGCCNNFTFGRDGLGYYETIAGGAGAGACRMAWSVGVLGAHVLTASLTDAALSFFLRLLSLGPTWNGRSGVHTHMTNTRITDPEIFERRYPVVLHEFSLRKGVCCSGK